MWSQGITGESGGLEKQDVGQVVTCPYPGDTKDIRPVSFPFWMVREIALDLEEKSRLEAQQGLLEVEIGTYSRLVQGLEKENGALELQLELLEKNQQLLLLQVEAARNKRSGTSLKWVLRILAALGTGFILGSLNS